MFTRTENAACCTHGKVVAFLNRGHKVKLLPAEKDDPAGWVRLEHAAYGLEERGVLMQLGNLKDLSYGDGDFALEERFDKVSWVINGRRTRAWMSDVNLLRTFLSGRLVLKEFRDEQVPLKRRIDRLRELLGEAKKYEHLNVTTGCSAATDFFTVGPNGRLRVCNHSPIELVRWHEWKRLPDCEEWRHYMCHDYLPEACMGCADATKCLGGCREAARVFHGSPLAPDPLCARTQN